MSRTALGRPGTRQLRRSEDRHRSCTSKRHRGTGAGPGRSRRFRMRGRYLVLGRLGSRLLPWLRPSSRTAGGGWWCPLWRASHPGPPEASARSAASNRRRACQPSSDAADEEVLPHLGEERPRPQGGAQGTPRTRPNQHRQEAAAPRGHFRHADADEAGGELAHNQFLCPEVDRQPADGQPGAPSCAAPVARLTKTVTPSSYALKKP